MTIPAVSLTQPWASLIVWGRKHMETRDWAPSYRGPLLIHASKTVPEEMLYWIYRAPQAEPLRQAVMERGFRRLSELPMGALVAVCTLETVFPTSALAPLAAELPFGDYSPGRAAWILRDITPLPEPIPARGRPSLWPYDGEIPVPLPPARTPRIRIVHCKREPYDLYIGRALPNYGFPGSPLGNPYRDGSAILRFRDHFAGLPALQAYARERYTAHQARHPGETFTLGCWCKTPEFPTRPCHGDVIAAWLLGVSDLVTVKPPDGEVHQLALTEQAEALP